MQILKNHIRTPGRIYLYLLLILGLFVFQSHAQTAPADLMRNCHQWKITYPDGVEEKKLCEESSNEYFSVSAAGDALVFFAPVRSDNGTTPNSSYIRSELREREEDGSADIYWTTSGRHVLYVDQAITHLPIVKSHLVATQIHGNKSDGIDDSMVLRLEGSHLFLSFNGGKLRDDLTIKTDYVLGTRHEVIFEVVDGKHYCYYSEAGGLLEAFNNGTADAYLVKDSGDPVLMDLSYDQTYFKVGNYTQSNAEKEGEYTDDPDNYGEVYVYDFIVEHGDAPLSSSSTLSSSSVNPSSSSEVSSSSTDPSSSSEVSSSSTEPSSSSQSSLAPYEIGKFQDYLQECKLQSPTSSTEATQDEIISGYSSNTFYVADENKIAFTQTGTGNRTELRYLDNWFISDYNQTFHANLKIVEQTADQVTILQIHDDANDGEGPNKPLVRIYSHTTKDPGNHLWAAVKTDIGGENTEHFDLGATPPGYFDVDILLVDGELQIQLNDNQVLAYDVSFWTYPSYWKNGVYLQDEGSATVYFNELTLSQILREEPTKLKPSDLVLKEARMGVYAQQNTLHYQTTELAATKHLKIYSLTGDLVQTLSVNKLSGQLDVGMLPPGVYSVLFTGAVFSHHIFIKR